MKTGFDLIESEHDNNDIEEFKLKSAVIFRILIRDVKDTAYQYARSFGSDVIQSHHIIDTLKYQSRIFCQQEKLEERFAELYNEVKNDLVTSEEDEENDSVEDISEKNDESDSEDSEGEENSEEDEISNMANYILLEEALTENRETLSPDSLARLQKNVQQCVNAWELWNPTSNFEILLKRSIDFAAKK